MQAQNEHRFSPELHAYSFSSQHSTAQKIGYLKVQLRCFVANLNIDKVMRFLCKFLGRKNALVLLFTLFVQGEGVTIPKLYSLDLFKYFCIILLIFYLSLWDDCGTFQNWTHYVAIPWRQWPINSRGGRKN